MEIRAICRSEIEAARQLLLSAGWDRKVSDADQFAKLISQSQLALVAVSGGQVVGFIRALTDGMTNGTISMVVVAEALRGTGTCPGKPVLASHDRSATGPYFHD